jgi:hypothetical protein
MPKKKAMPQDKTAYGSKRPTTGSISFDPVCNICINTIAFRWLFKDYLCRKYT